MQKKSDRVARVQARAYEMWEKEGRPHGKDQAHWFAAESELGGATRAAAAAKRTTTNTVKARGAASGRRTGRERNPDETA